MTLCVFLCIVTNIIIFLLSERKLSGYCGILQIFCTFGHWLIRELLCPGPGPARSCSRCCVPRGYEGGCWPHAPMCSPLAVCWCWSDSIWRTPSLIPWWCGLRRRGGPRRSAGSQRTPRAACVPWEHRVYKGPQHAPARRVHSFESEDKRGNECSTTVERQKNPKKKNQKDKTILGLTYCFVSKM